MSEKISIRDHVLRTSVDEVIALLESRIHPGIELVNNISDEIRIAVDPGLLTLILLNLISNSLESIPETGKISINVESLKNQTAIFVEDDGMTIPDQHVKQLFKLGFTTKESHVGIGLYVSNRLLKQQDGDLYFARDFRTNVKVFGVRLPTPRNTGTGLEDPNAIKQRIYLLQNSIENIKRELLQFRSQEITESQQGALSKEFQRMTSTFSKNLNNELLLIEATILDAINKLPTDDIATENAFRKIIRNCAYCRLLTSNILALGEGASPELEEISLIDIIEEVLLLVDRKMPPDLYKIEWDIDSLLPNIKADALQMKQVFMNLIKNALDAMSFGGALKIKLGVEESFVVAEVEDTGMGIDPINLPRLFQLGFTTKIKGYGIGLFSIKKIIERHNGKIEVSSVVDRGTAFKISLPFDPKEAK